MSETTHNPHRILLTGSAGSMGRVIGPALVGRGHFVRGFDREASEGVSESCVGDLTDAAAVRAAAEGVDTIVHLAAYPDPADFVQVLVPANVVGLYHVMDAAVREGVGRVVLASTAQVVTGLTVRPWRIEDGTAPTNLYALTKVWAESMGEMYARRHGLSVLAVRIGWFVRNPEEARRLVELKGEALYFSPPDTVRFHAAAVESDRPGPGEFAAVFATSRPLGEAIADPQPARDVLGYEPQDTFPEHLGFEY